MTACVTGGPPLPHCDIQTVFTPSLCIECVPRRYLPDGLHHLHGQRRGIRSAPSPPRLGRQPDQDIYVADGLKTGRIMAKDEDVCLHCGPPAVPTGAWDRKEEISHRNDLRGNDMPARSPIGSVNDFSPFTQPESQELFRKLMDTYAGFPYRPPLTHQSSLRLEWENGSRPREVIGSLARIMREA
jgi:hypothetical protein